jgi:hypothetical protein
MNCDPSVSLEPLSITKFPRFLTSHQRRHRNCRRVCIDTRIRGETLMSPFSADACGHITNATSCRLGIVQLTVPVSQKGSPQHAAGSTCQVSTAPQMHVLETHHVDYRAARCFDRVSNRCLYPSRLHLIITIECTSLNWDVASIFRCSSVQRRLGGRDIAYMHFASTT